MVALQVHLLVMELTKKLKFSFKTQINRLIITSKSPVKFTGAGDVGSGVGVFVPLDSFPRLSILLLARERLVSGNFK